MSTASKTTFADANATSAATPNVSAGTITNTTAPAITGTARVGLVLTASAGSWNPSDVSTSLQWLAGGVDIPGATGATYTPVAGDLGKAITVRVTAAKTGYTTANVTSDATSNVGATLIANLTVPTVTGTPRVGRVLTAYAGTWNPCGVTTAFQWRAGGVDVAGATSSTYTPVARRRGEDHLGAGDGEPGRLPRGRRLSRRRAGDVGRRRSHVPRRPGGQHEGPW